MMAVKKTDAFSLLFAQKSFIVCLLYAKSSLILIGFQEKQVGEDAIWDRGKSITSGKKQIWINISIKSANIT